MLLTAWPSSSDDGVGVGATIRVYEFALEGISTEYVERAVKAFVQGRVPDHDREFRPKPARLAEYARSLQASEDRIREIAARVEDQISRIEYKGPPQAVRDEQVRKWQALKADNSRYMVEDGPSRRRMPHQDPARWTDKDELRASAERLRQRGYMGEQE